MKVPKNLLYSEDHIWVGRKGNKAKIGVTEFITLNSGEIREVNIEEDEEARIEAGDVIGEIITDDGSFEIISPVSGKISRINHEVIENPQILAEDPYRDGWIVEIELDSQELENLLKPHEYEKFLKDIEE